MMNITNITLPLREKKTKEVFFLSYPSLQDLVFKRVIFTAS